MFISNLKQKLQKIGFAVSNPTPTKEGKILAFNVYKKERGDYTLLPKEIAEINLFLKRERLDSKWFCAFSTKTKNNASIRSKARESKKNKNRRETERRRIDNILNPDLTALM
jgi:hypothetical protein